MGFFKRLFGAEERADSTENITEPDSALLRALVGDGKISAKTALEIPAFSACVDFVANTVAMLPIKLYKENAEAHTTEEVTDDPRLRLLNDEAGGNMSALETKRAQIRDMLVYGAGYVYIERGRGGIQSLRYVDNRDVAVIKNADPIFKDADILVGSHHFYPFDFVILTRNSKDGVTGSGLVEEHNTLLSSMYNSLTYENTLTKTGGNKKGFLQADHRLSKQALDEVKVAWEELYANNANNMMVLNDGLKYVPSASTSVELQMNQNKTTNAAMIAQAAGLSPEIISGNANEQQYMSGIRTAVLPAVEEYQSSLNRALLLESEKKSMYFALDTAELLKGDTLSRYQAYAIGLQNNFLQIDEVRYMEDKPPLGFNYIKLGLQDVLLDPKTGQIYTPNTNQSATMGDEKQSNNAPKA